MNSSREQLTLFPPDGIFGEDTIPDGEPRHRAEGALMPLVPKRFDSSSTREIHGDPHPIESRAAIGEITVSGVAHGPPQLDGRAMDIRFATTPLRQAERPIEGRGI